MRRSLEYYILAYRTAVMRFGEPTGILRPRVKRVRRSSAFKKPRTAARKRLHEPFLIAPRPFGFESLLPVKSRIFSRIVPP
jgi:hypothetical protein